MLELDKVGFRYGRSTALTDVSLQLSNGANILLGRNGAGKTTLMRVLAGAASPAEGSVRLSGESIFQASRPDRRMLHRIGWLPQTFGYPPNMRVVEFVAYAAWLKEVPRPEVLKRCDDVLALVNLTAKRKEPLKTLSGGQLRRAGLAAALVADPEMLILDEPTAGLDPEQRDAFHDLVRKVRTEKIVVVATHLLEDVEALAEHIVVIDGGSVRWSGTPAELVERGGGEPGLAALRHGLQSLIGQQS